MALNAANKERGEITLTHSDTEADEVVSYVLRPTFDSIMKIESALNTSVIQLARDIRMMEMGTTKMATIFCATCVSHDVELAEAGEIIYEMGFEDAFAGISMLIANMLNGGRPPKKPKKEPEKKKKPRKKKRT